MPDPAIDAIRAGLLYTEPPAPTSLFGKKKLTARVTFQTNPNDPAQPPRRVIDVGNGKGGGGWWGRKIGGRGVVWDEKPLTGSTSFGSRPMPMPSSHSAAQGISSHSAAQQKFQPRAQQLSAFCSLDPSMAYGYPLSAQPPTAIPTSAGMFDPHLFVQPLPDNFWSLPWRERRHLEKMRADQMKMAKEWEKANKEWDRAQAVEAKERYRAEVKQRKKDLKAQEKLLKQQRKHPERFLPNPTPATLVPAATLPAPGGSQGNVKWMMKPTYEEFGVRRPFDTIGSLPRSGQGEWPMMSRTMTHALVDMSREERVHAVSAGTVYGGGWGGHW